ncbi:hypothetical protein [Nocardia wallacei]|uniref:hypothetical protein n=1 Tax=Nocardia wallacei TaxID=480035 RepID=UPI002454309A|nr:hypothetical protein [Nocardia wallacei]
MAIKVKFNQKALRDLEKPLNIEVSLVGTEADAIRAVKQQYKKAKGIELDTDAARKIVRRARGH